MTTHQTALSFLRLASVLNDGREGLLPTALRVFHEQKGFPVAAVQARPVLVGHMLTQHLTRASSSNAIATAYPFIVRASLAAPDTTLPIVKYRGSAEQNVAIDRAVTIYNSNANFHGEGAAALLRVAAILGTSDAVIKDTPIAIIGRGPAGILSLIALKRLGFRNIKVFEKKTPLGIWSQPNVKDGTKNNPRQLTFDAVAALNVASGNGTKDGKEVSSFLETALNSAGLDVTIGASTVHDVHPSSLSTTLSFGEKLKEKFPIVINAAGTGSPRPFTDPSDQQRMELLGSSDRPVAVRWQQVGLTRADVQGKRFIFIGLGNSTAEMISQLHDLKRAGAQVDYKILTHYPEDSIFNPNDVVDDEYENTFRVFRDLNKPDLTGFQGDLPRSRSDYYQALLDKNIISDVTSWGVKDGEITYQLPYGGRGAFKFDKLFVLTGYQHDNESYSKLGLYAPNNYPVSDYDGELHNSKGRIKGYFGIGAVMDAPHNRNVTVIPGIMFRMPDMLYSVVMRAIEYNLPKL